MKISVETHVNAPIGEVWRAYTTPEDIQQWNAASDDWHTTAGPQGVLVRVNFDAETTHPVKQQRAGWQAILDNFKRHVEATAAPAGAGFHLTSP